MHKDKKRLIIIGVLFTLFFIIVAIVISLITSYAKNKDAYKQESDSYPESYVYMGVKYDASNGYEVIVPLDENFDEIDLTTRTFYSIKDINVFNKKVYVYSDALNEVAYNKNDNRLYLNEINSYYDSKSTVKLARDYIVLFETNGSIKYIKNVDDSAEETEIAKNLESQNIAVIDNAIYYRDDEGIVYFDIANKSSNVIVPSSDDYNPFIVDYNNKYILLKSNEEYSIYDIENKNVIYVNELIIDTDIKMLSLYGRGFIYEKNDTHELVSYNLIFNKTEDEIYIRNDDFVVNSIYYIDGSLMFIEMVKDNEYKYYIYNSVKRDFIKELKEGYKYIVKVQ